MAAAKIQDSRNAVTYTEFVRAKFLTEPLYNGWNKTTRVVVPRNLHRSRLLLSPATVRKLDRLNYSLTVRRGTRGANQSVGHIEHQMRSMRKPGPVEKLWRQARNKKLMNEDLACVFIIAFGRAGALRTVARKILQGHYGIADESVFFVDISQGEEEPSIVAAKQRRLKAVVPDTQSQALLRPNERLMEAIVEAFASNGEITTALLLVEKIAREHGVPVPMRVWTDLLEWAHIMGSKPYSTMWRAARLDSKLPQAHAVEVIWHKMRAAEPGAEPDFKQLSIMAQSYLGRGRHSDAYPYLKALLVLYRAQCDEYQRSGLEYTQCLRDGALSNSTLNQYERARFRRQAQWYSLNRLCHRFLVKYRPRPEVHDGATSSLIPAFIEEFREFIPNPATYRTPSGSVFLFDPATENSLYLGVGLQSLNIAFKGRTDDGFPQQSGRVRSVQQRRLFLLSRRSLEGQWSSKLKPQRLLRDVRPSFRMTGTFASAQGSIARRVRRHMQQNTGNDDVLS